VPSVSHTTTDPAVMAAILALWSGVGRTDDPERDGYSGRGYRDGRFGQAPGLDHREGENCSQQQYRNYLGCHTRHGVSTKDTVDRNSFAG
jgi:hypothetical protein